LLEALCARYREEVEEGKKEKKIMKRRDEKKTREK